ncbi:MAG TPA: haloacid dehalogenase type II [Frankiaceae bacterium]|nr:haloacid dehalogenase type II [Frankiaceae bacterium]
MPRIHVVAFDVNETLSDLAPLAAHFTAAGLPADLRTAWFASTLRDGFALAAAGTEAPFADIAGAALRSLLHGRPDLTADPDDVVAAVLGAFQQLGVHPDVAEGMRTLARGGLRLVTLTNGAASVGRGLLERAGLADVVEDYLSVEAAGRWKPARQAYQLAADRTGVPIEQIALVAVHPWDTDGAKRAGMISAWINRNGSPYPSVFTPPDIVGADLPAVAAQLLAQSEGLEA